MQLMGHNIHSTLCKVQSLFSVNLPSCATITMIQFQNISRDLSKSLCPLAFNLCAHPVALISVSVYLLWLDILYKRNHAVVFFHVWLLSLNIMLLRFIHVVVCCQIVIHCIDWPYCLYPFTGCWTSGLHPLWGYSKQCSPNPY